ncbi:hypothetical protein [Rhodococcus sp. NPDC058521]|uniref:hypothetical protein n=1 Tax=Rhodococcus sp. NPDC058521 TaxID=3346536 RepID=UPI00365E435D
MSDERRPARFLPVRLALASAGIVGLLAGGSVVTDAPTSDSTAAPLVAAGDGPADAVSSGS